MTTAEIEEVLTSLGYSLTDRGAYWQTNALFRDGDNKTALQIYKDSGVWRDFVAQTPPLKFERLVEKSVGGDSSEAKKLLSTSQSNALADYAPPQAPKMKMENIFPSDYLKKLLPHYRFYNDRGISDLTLSTLKGGLATQGQLYQRFVFPIYNQDGQIHGFSGRDMLNKEGRPKWKHIGKKSQWLYPAYVPFKNETFLQRIEDSSSVFLVESIGDLLALHERGHYNILVTFGLAVSPSLISLLVQLNPSQIIFSFNNDSTKAQNRGLNAALTNYLKLLSYFDFGKLRICLPPANDFGEMTDQEFDLWDEKLNSQDIEEQGLLVLKHSLRLADTKQLSQKLIKNRNLLAGLLYD